MAGGVVASIGLILGVFSPSIQILYLTFGLISGVDIGFGLVNVAKDVLQCNLGLFNSSSLLAF